MQGQLQTMGEQMRMCQSEALGMKEHVAAEIARSIDRTNEDFYEQKN